MEFLFINGFFFTKSHPFKVNNLKKSKKGKFVLKGTNYFLLFLFLLMMVLCSKYPTLSIGILHNKTRRRVFILTLKKIYIKSKIIFKNKKLK